MRVTEHGVTPVVGCGRVCLCVRVYCSPLPRFVWNLKNVSLFMFLTPLFLIENYGGDLLLSHCKAWYIKNCSVCCKVINSLEPTKLTGHVCRDTGCKTEVLDSALSSLDDIALWPLTDQYLRASIHATHTRISSTHAHYKTWCSGKEKSSVTYMWLDNMKKFNT